MIVSAALLLTNKNNNAHSIILPCVRHGNGYSILKFLDIDYHDYDIVEGFVTNENKFLDREEAFELLRITKSISATICEYKLQHNESELYSEDLY